LLYVPLPDAVARLEILKTLTRKNVLENSGSFLQAVAERTQRYSGADLKSLVRDACLRCLDEIAHIDDLVFTTASTPLGSDIQPHSLVLTEKLFLQAMQTTSPSVSEEDEKRYLELQRDHAKMYHY